MSEIDLSVVVPVRDERDNLRPFVAELVPVLCRLGERFEVLLVDDGSTDGSSGLLDELAAEDARIRALHLAAPCGLSSALDAGFRASRGPLVATLDADLQIDPADLPGMLAALDGCDAVVGVRRRRRDSWWRRISSRLANRVRDLLTADAVADTACPLKVFRAEAIRSVRMWEGAHRFLPTLLRNEGFIVREAEVGHRRRRAGRSKSGTWRRAASGLRDALGVRWMRDRRLRWRLRP